MQKGKRTKSLSSTQKKWLAGFISALVFLLPYERIPSLPITILGTSIDLRLSFIAAGGLMIFVAWLAVFAGNILKFRLQTVHKWLGAFFFVYLLSALLSDNLGRALAVWVFTVFTATTAVVLGQVWSHRNDAQVQRLLMITTCIVLGFGFYQYFGDLLGLSTSLTGLRDIYVKEIFGFPRIQSTGLEPLYYGNFLLIPLFFFSWSYLRSASRKTLALVLLIVTQLVLTVSRGAIYGGLVGLIALFLLYSGGEMRRKMSLIGAMFVGALLAFVMTSITSLSIFSTNDQTPGSATQAAIAQATNFETLDDRVRNRLLAWQAFQEYPILGIGPGNFGQYATERYESYASAEGHVIVNNEPLELLAESGLAGFFTFLGFAITLCWGLFKLARQQSSHVWPAVVLVYLVALAVQYQSFSTLYIMHVWVMMGIGMGLVQESTKKLRTKITS